MKYITILAGLTLLGMLPGCSSSGPAPAATAIQGQVGRTTTAPTVETVALSSTTTPVTTTLREPATDGSYRFEGLAAGTYTLSFMPASGYLPPPAQTVRVTASTTSTVPLITPASGQYRFGTQGSAEYRVGPNGIEVGAVTARQTGNSLQLSFEPGVGFAGKQLTLQLLGFAGQVGTFYPDNPTANVHLVYSETAGTTVATWSTTNSFPGSVVITAVTTTPRRVSGTFTAEVAPDPTATANRTVVGYFSQVPY